VSASFDPGALLGNSYSLEGGLRVRLRLTRSSDAGSIRTLLERQGLDPEDLQAARLVHFDPRTRYVLCATALIDSTETLLGVAAIELDPGGSDQPDTVIVDDGHSAELGELLTSALVGRASTVARSRAA
jgi:hypothetical protein